MKIGIGNDHAAVELKNIISEHLKERGRELWHRHLREL